MNNIFVYTVLVFSFLSFIPAGIVGAMETLGTGGTSASVEAQKKVATSSWPSGDPDFDLLRIIEQELQIKDVDLDGDIKEIEKTLSPQDSKVDNSGFIKIRDTDSAPDDDKIIGDPDFDLLDIDFDEDYFDLLREEMFSDDDTDDVIVRGWDPKKKEEILAEPEDVEDEDDLKIYIEAFALDMPEITDIKIDTEMLEVISREKGKLFWFIPVAMDSAVTIRFNVKDSTEDSTDITVKLPWWSVFAKKDFSASELEKDILAGLDSSLWEKVDNTDSVNDASMFARALHTISNVLKTRHDTAKNSISNVR